MASPLSRLAAPRFRLSVRAERHLLQATIAAAGFVPVLAGLAGALLGASLTGEADAGLALDSHVRFLSGLLLALGLAWWEAIPQIERRSSRVRLLTATIALGGLMQLVGAFVAPPSPAAIVALALELGVTPALLIWQARVARRCGMHL